jgi:hypothetical protein
MAKSPITRQELATPSIQPAAGSLNYAVEDGRPGLRELPTPGRDRSRSLIGELERCLATQRRRCSPP